MKVPKSVTQSDRFPIATAAERSSGSPSVLITALFAILLGWSYATNGVILGECFSPISSLLSILCFLEQDSTRCKMGVLASSSSLEWTRSDFPCIFSQRCKRGLHLVSRSPLETGTLAFTITSLCLAFSPECTMHAWERNQRPWRQVLYASWRRRTTAGRPCGRPRIIGLSQ